MGLFGSFFGKKKSSSKNEHQSLFDGDYDIDRSNWDEVFSACLGEMMTVQSAVAELVVRERDWNMDFERGVISFGQDEYPLQFIGSEAHVSNSWMWGWENINEFDEQILELANAARQTGEAWGLEPFATAQFELTETVNGHHLAIAACGIFSDNLCYYRGEHDAGAVFVAFSGVPDEVFDSVKMQKFIDITMWCIQQFEVNHIIFVEGFLIWNGTPYEWQGNTIVAHFDQDLRIDFEQSGEVWRISQIFGRRLS